MAVVVGMGSVREGVGSADTWIKEKELTPLVYVRAEGANDVCPFIEESNFRCKKGVFSVLDQLGCGGICRVDAVGGRFPLFIEFGNGVGSFGFATEDNEVVVDVEGMLGGAIELRAHYDGVSGINVPLGEARGNC